MVLIVGLIVTGLTLLPVVGLGRFEIGGDELFLESPLRRNPPSTRSVRAPLSDLFLSRETWLTAVMPCWKIALG